MEGYKHEFNRVSLNLQLFIRESSKSGSTSQRCPCRSLHPPSRPCPQTSPARPALCTLSPSLPFACKTLSAAIITKPPTYRLFKVYLPDRAWLHRCQKGQKLTSLRPALTKWPWAKFWVS